MATTHPSLAALVRRQIEAHYPYAACDDCLAVLLFASAQEVREESIVVARMASRADVVCATGADAPSR
jgi:hypothetical protein